MARSDVVVRVASAPGDLAGIEKIDRSYATGRIYRVRRSELGFWLEEERADPPLRKRYLQPGPELSDRLLVAAIGGEIVGCAELRFDSWSPRAEIEHLTVSGDVRRQGVGRLLIRALDERARREPSTRCLWLETQNINYPAVQFYRRLGFRLCGLDETLYRPDIPGTLPGEVALYFARDLA
ncbi:MAG TPA: GNAT family N-acetyltransferase [Streptosporangiaceae bacterium]|nr:GNAT family N-acetyltransferase [Streptosporangiaceae bacterium]